jgi:hypothetical protein
VCSFAQLEQPITNNDGILNKVCRGWPVQGLTSDIRIGPGRLTAPAPVPQLHLLQLLQMARTLVTAGHCQCYESPCTLRRITRIDQRDIRWPLNDRRCRRCLREVERLHYKRYFLYHPQAISDRNIATEGPSYTDAGTRNPHRAYTT